MDHEFDKDYWEQHWREGWRGGGPGSMSGHPANPYLISEVGGLTPGTALDAGCGAGAEAVWLASAGWQVTAVDISAVALAQAVQRAAASGVGDQVRWAQEDLSTWTPDTKFDLVATHYAHPAIPQLDFYVRISDWVAPGGTLLIVGHLHQHGHGHWARAWARRWSTARGHGERRGHHGSSGRGRVAGSHGRRAAAQRRGSGWRNSITRRRRRTRHPPLDTLRRWKVPVENGGLVTEIIGGLDDAAPTPWIRDPGARRQSLRRGPGRLTQARREQHRPDGRGQSRAKVHSDG